MRRRPTIWFYLLLSVLAVMFALPLVAILLTSLKSNVETRTLPIELIPREWTVQAYQALLGPDSQSPILLWFANSMIAATAHAALVLVVASTAGYALARMDFPGKRVVFAMIISTLFVPGFIFLMPNFLILDKLGWLDTLLALIVPGAAGAFGVFFLRQFFLGLPRELEESARIDGAGPFRTFWSVVLPNTKPALVTLGVLSFLANWNDFIWPIYVMFSDERLTLPVGLSRLQGAYTTDYPVIMAGACVAAVPVLLLYAFVQRYVIDGVASSGLKG